MEILLIAVIIFLILLIWFITSSENDLHKRYKDLQKEYADLKLKYDTQNFELKKYKNEDVKRNKEIAKDFLTDTAYWMKRTFYYAKENQILKRKEKK